MVRYEITPEGKVGKPYTGGEKGPLPFTADFAENEEGGMTLVRWPRTAGAAVLPKEVNGKTLTAIGATAFAPEHLPEELLEGMYDSVVSYSMFCMKMGRRLMAETLDEGGPRQVEIPKSVERIGAYAFWKCKNLKKVRIPEKVKELCAGTFGECVNLEKAVLAEGLLQIGYMPRAARQIMPDVGAFAGCHSLKEIVFPQTLLRLGAQTFNSAGLERIGVVSEAAEGEIHKIEVDETAFSHAASLLWMDKLTKDGKVGYRIGLPAAMDKILAGDRKFGLIQKIPVHFFQQPVGYFDDLARKAFRLDFSARMALARLRWDEGLSGEYRKWYLNLLVEYFGQGKQFMPCGGNAFQELFDFLKECNGLTAAQMSSLIRTAGELNLSAELISHMMEIRNQRFHAVTGFEDLELD